MLQFKDLWFRNFQAYGNVPTHIHLDKPGTHLITGSNGTGKAQPLTSLIKTPTGWVQMGDVKLNDNIVASDGSICQIDGIYPQGNIAIYELTFADGRKVRACGDHLWCTSSISYNHKDTTVSRTISTNDIIRHLDKHPQVPGNGTYSLYIPLSNHIDIPDITLPLDPYLLGILLGDGHMGLRGTGVNITSADMEIVDRCDTILKNTLNMQLVVGSSKYCWRVQSNTVKGKQIKTSPLRVVLESLDLQHSRSHNKFIPEIYKHASVQQKHTLLQGLMDSDGYVGSSKDISYSTTSEQLAIDIQYLIRSLGGIAKIRQYTPYCTYKGIYKAGRTAYTVSIRYKKPEELFHLTRKKIKLGGSHQYKDNLKLRIEKVEYIGVEPAQCIHINHPEHLYITNDFVVTHNTTIIQALVFLMYGKVISSTSANEAKVDDLINNINKKYMEVTGTLFKSNTGYYKFSRARKMQSGAAGNYIKVWFNPDVDEFDETHEITLGGAGATDKFIEGIIGMPFDMFVRIVVVSASNKPFLDLPVSSTTQTSQIGCIERLFNITIMSEKGNALKQVMKSTDDVVKMLKKDIEHIENSRLRDLKQLEALTKNADQWDDNKQQQIAILQAKLDKVSDVDVEAEQLLHEQLTAVNKDRSLIEAMYQKLEYTLLKRQDTQTKLQKEHTHLADSKCPYCEQHYDNADKLTEIQNTLVTLQDEIETITTEYIQLEQSVDELTIQCTDVHSKITVKQLSELLNIRDIRNTVSVRIEELSKSTNTYLDQVAVFQNELTNEADYTELNALTDTVAHQQFLHKMLTKKDSFIRKKLLQTNLIYLNTQLHGYLSTLELPFKVSFNFQMLAEITQLGRSLQFSNLSNGQRARVNLALTMAFRDVLQKMHAPINICLLDEALDVGLDNSGILAAIKMLKHKAREDNTAIFIITHRDEPKTSFDNVISVKLENEFSVIY